MYTTEEKSALRTTWAALAAKGQITLLHVEDDCVQLEYSDEARKELARLIVDASAFDLCGITENFFQFEFDSAEAAHQTRMRLTTGFSNDSWAVPLPDKLAAFVVSVAMDELDEIFTREDVYEMAKHCREWQRLYDEYMKEMEGVA